MKTLINTSIWLVAALVSLISCHRAADPTPDPVSVVTAWQSADSALAITSHQALSVYADSLGLVVSTKGGLFFRPKNTSQTIHVAYSVPPYGLAPTFYKGVAYTYVSTTQLIGIPYAQPGAPTIAIPLNVLSLPPQSRTGYQQFSTDYPISITSKGQMLVQIDDSMVPQYLYSLFLGPTGRPLTDPAGRPQAKLIDFPDASFTFTNAPVGSFYSYGYFTANDQLFVATLHAFANQQDSVALGELQRVTATGTVETALPHLTTRNLVGYNKALYAVSRPLSGPGGLGMYKSTDDGRSWQRLYEAADRLINGSTKFLVVANHVVVNLGYQLLAMNMDTGQTKALSLTGLPEDRGTITGLIAYNDKLYLSTDRKGIFTREVTDFWP